MGFFKQEYWSGVTFPPAGDLPDLGVEPTSLVSPALAGFLYQLSHLLVTHQSTCGLPVRRHLFILDAILWNVFGDAKKICPPLVRSE